jgi:NAD(P)-dependent dehydrogenase (short-subunit alcohol dehydrogenase family)
MAKRAILITGAARYSLGEAIVAEYLRRTAGAQIFVINRSRNPDLNEKVREIILDLNPLHHQRGVVGFADEISEKLQLSVKEAKCCGIGCLIQTAAVYDYGQLSDYDASRRSGLLGLNILGTTEVLFAVLALNARLQLAHENSFSQILIGAFQGLEIREGRQLYASSKAWGIDLCTSLVAGTEIARCIYAAPGPIDTPMLHRNHWVKKAKGSEQFFDAVLRGPRAEYESIFLRCESRTLIKVARRRPATETVKLHETMNVYRVERSNAQLARLGVLSAGSCAAVLVDTELCHERGSGVYLIGTSQNGEPFIKMTTFDALDRNRLFLSLARDLCYPCANGAARD